MGSCGTGGQIKAKKAVSKLDVLCVSFPISSIEIAILKKFGF